MSVFASDIILAASDGGNGTGAKLPDYIGYAATGLAVLFYGSNYVPVKKFDTGDGMFFQFFLCVGIWSVAMVVNAVRAFPTFHPIVMIGGAIWTFGNLFAVPIIQTIGMGLGILIWGIFNMLTGWATGRFGIFGIPPQVPSNILFNYVGVGLSACASLMFFFVKPEVAAAQVETAEGGGPGGGGSGGGNWQQYRHSLSDQEGSISVYEDVFGGAAEGGSRLYPSLNSRPADDKLPIVVADSGQGSGGLGAGQQQRQRGPFWLRLPPAQRRFFGIALAVMIGPMFGVGFVPTFYVQSHVAGASENGLDYVFAHFTGIFVASIIFLMAYTAVTGNRPAVNPRIILPAIISGVMWGVAGASWFLANQVLSESISYPIISTAPAIVAALWSVCVFREIRGVRNLIMLVIAITMSAVGSTLNGFSRS